LTYIYILHIYVYIYIYTYHIYIFGEQQNRCHLSFASSSYSRCTPEVPGQNWSLSPGFEAVGCGLGGSEDVEFRWILHLENPWNPWMENL